MKHSLSFLLLTTVLLSLVVVGMFVAPATAAPLVRDDKAKKTVVTDQKQTPAKSTIKKNVSTGEKVLAKNQKSSVSTKKTSLTKPQPVATAATKKVATKKKTVAKRTAPKIETVMAAIQDDNEQLSNQISAKSAIIMDADNGHTLFAVSPDAPRQPASTIKILTGLIAIKSLDFNESVAVSQKAAEQPSSKVNLQQQKRYKADDLINAVLLSSANDASVALAEKIAGSEQSFARMMTLRAKFCGAQNTVCKTANGLTAEGQSTTARDLATIFRHAMQDEEFSQRMKQVKAHTAEGKLLKNHNKALWQIQGAEGGKTGFTNAAGQTYVGKFKRGEKEIIVAIMGSHTMWADLKTLVEYGFAQPPSTIARTSELREKSRFVAAVPGITRQQ
ncbi:MAG: D-alanyl-D-alanine [Desulfobulbaceae bacterium]|nr:MAG: D-alanyl-D-alanine [Desulfobulbaceae bacterium]